MAYSPTAGISPLDAAYGHAAAGKQLAALRTTVALLEHHLQDQALAAEAGGAATTPPLDAALLLAELLQQGHPALAKQAAGFLRDAFIGAGDLPHAVVAARLAATADDGMGSGLAALGGHLRPVAQAYARGSARLSERGRTPPALPAEGFAVPSDIASLEGKALVARGAAVLQKILESTPAPTSNGPIPRLPLFSALPEAALTRLLALMLPRDLKESEELISRGDEGTDLFVVVRGILEAYREDTGGRQRLATLGPGAIVGEMALVSEAPRAASVRALEPTRVLSVSKAALEREAGAEAAIGAELARFCRQRMLANLMHHSFVLRDLTREERAELLERFQTRNVEEGSELVREGEPGPGLFLIAAGHVRVTRRDSDGDALVIAELGPGEVVGEISLVLRRPATATVEATHASVILFLPADEFQEVVAAHPGLLSQLYALAVNRDDELNTVLAQQAMELDEVTLI